MITRSMDELNRECFDKMTEFVTIGAEKTDGLYYGVAVWIVGKEIKSYVTETGHTTHGEALKAILQAMPPEIHLYPYLIALDAAPMGGYNLS